jgi:hypothetical protein
MTWRKHNRILQAVGCQPHIARLSSFRSLVKSAIKVTQTAPVFGGCSHVRSLRSHKLTRLDSIIAQDSCLPTLEETSSGPPIRVRRCPRLRWRVFSSDSLTVWGEKWRWRCVIHSYVNKWRCVIHSYVNKWRCVIHSYVNKWRVIHSYVNKWHRDVDGIYSLLGYYTASCGNCLPTCRDNVSVTSWPVKIGPIRCSETSGNSYHTTPCNIPEESRSQVTCLIYIT